MLCGSMVCVCGVLYECTENIDCVWYECTDKVCVLHEYTDALVWVAVLYECVKKRCYGTMTSLCMTLSAVLQERHLRKASKWLPVATHY